MIIWHWSICRNPLCTPYSIMNNQLEKNSGLFLKKR